MLSESNPIVRRFLRFLALPYCFVFYINWSECKISKFQVAKDLLYVFFKLKYFPDNYSICRLWEKPREEWVYYYGSVYDAWQRRKLRKKVFPFKYRLIYDDKHICYLLCKAYNLPLPKTYGVVNKSDFKQKITNILNDYPSKTLIAKPVEGRGGNGIILLRKIEGKIFVQGKNIFEPLESHIFFGISVLQEYIEQHKDISNMSNSVNTIRIVTMLTKNDEVIFLGARMRFGVGESFLDNTSQGGIAVKIDMAEGTLENTASDNKALTYFEHPTSKINFNGYKIPYWTDVLLLAENVQRCLQYNKMLGQDIGISTDGPVIIELNAEYDNVMFEQVCGPILKNKKVKEEFQKYNLLINRYQREI